MINKENDVAKNHVIFLISLFLKRLEKPVHHHPCQPFQSYMINTENSHLNRFDRFLQLFQFFRQRFHIAF